MAKKPLANPNEAALIAEKQQELLNTTANFCDRYLNADYKRLTKKLIDRMAKERPVPFLRGRLDIWAAGIIQALGSLNFLYDKSFKPYMTAEDIAVALGVSPSSASQKAGQIRKTYALHYGSTEFLTKQMKEQMSGTFAMMAQMQAMMEGDFAAPADEDTLEDGEFVGRDHPVMETFYMLAKRFDPAGPSPALEKPLRSLIEADPDFYDSYLMLRDLLHSQGRLQEANALLNTAVARAEARLTAFTGDWPPTLEWSWLENRHIIRTFLNKALADWTEGQTEAALALFHKLLRANPNDNGGARYYILAIRLGMTFAEYERTFESTYGYDAMKMITWFDSHIDRFPEDFTEWRKAVGFQKEKMP